MMNGQRSVCGRCPVPGGYSSQAIGAGSVLGLVTASPRPAYRNVEREIISSETVDWGPTLLNSRLYWHRFSAVFLCPRGNAIQHRRERLRSHSQGGGGTSDGKTRDGDI